VTHLRLNVNFNQPINNLPQNLTHLRLNNFDRPIDNLPKNLTHLSLGYNFVNQRIDDLNFPQTLTHLTFECEQPVNNLPKTVTHLTNGTFQFTRQPGTLNYWLRIK
jgi:hypothetical protein